MFLSILKKLKNCKHKNVNAYNYVRDDGILDDIINADDYKRRDYLEQHLTGMRFCLDCGATQRFKRWDPLAIAEGSEEEPWTRPWIWRNN